jgi:hypothetical protein
MSRGEYTGALLAMGWAAFGLAAGIDTAQHEHDPAQYELSTYLWVAWLAIWGATVSYLQKTKDRPGGFSWRILAIEWITAPAAGVLAFWAGEAMGADLLLTASSVFVAGYAGRQFVSRIERAERE